jgi:hypothetical protein
MNGVVHIYQTPFCEVRVSERTLAWLFSHKPAVRDELDKKLHDAVDVLAQMEWELGGKLEEI